METSGSATGVTLPQALLLLTILKSAADLHNPCSEASAPLALSATTLLRQHLTPPGASRQNTDVALPSIDTRAGVERPFMTAMCD